MQTGGDTDAVDREAEDRRIAELHEREFRERVVQVVPEPGDEFFPDIPVGLEMEFDQRQALSDFRAVLARARPQFLRPADTSGRLDYLGGYLRLCAQHAAQPDLKLELTFGDGFLSLSWPCGEEHDRWHWSPLMTQAVDALITGRNRQTIYLLRGRPTAADTWMLNGSRPRKLRRWRVANSLTWVIPTSPLARREVRISFDDPSGFEALP